MDWTKIPTTIISKRYSDYEILSIVKFQLIWAMNEEQPDKTTALRYMTAKQYETAMTYLDSISSTVSDEVSSVKQKRCAEKIRYSKNKELLKILPTDCKHTVSSMPEQIREDKIKEEKEIYKEKFEIDFDSFKERWNRNASNHDNIPKVTLMTTERKKALLARLHDLKSNGYLDTIDSFFARVGEAYDDSEFLQGRRTEFSFTLDFVLQKKSFQKIIEKSYR